MTTMPKIPKPVGPGPVKDDPSPLEKSKKKVNLSFPEFGFILVTRAALGAGGLLLATSRMKRPSRQRLGTILLGLGALTTVPAAFLLFGGKSRRTPLEQAPEKIEGGDAADVLEGFSDPGRGVR